MSEGIDPKKWFKGLSWRSEYDTLTIRNRTLNFKDRTIHIMAIANISVVQPGRVLAIILLVLGLLGLIVRVINPFFLPGSALLVVIGLVVYGGYLLTRKSALVISSSDGRISALTSRSVPFLRDVKALLDERLETAGDQPPVTVNAVTNQIQQMTVGEIKDMTIAQSDAVVSQSPGAVVANNSSGVTSNVGNSIELGAGAALNGNGVLSGADMRSHHETTSNETANTSTTINTLGGGSILNNGDMQTGPINFGQSTDEMIAFYKSIYEENLPREHKVMVYDLLMMMHNGVEKPEEKRKVRTMAETLSDVFQAYPGAVQLFSHVAQLAV